VVEGRSSLSEEGLSLLAGTLLFLCWLALGVVCTLFPERIQALVRDSRPGSLLNFGFRFRLVRGYIQSTAYLVVVRIGGVLSLVAAGIILYALLRSLSVVLR